MTGGLQTSLPSLHLLKNLYTLLHLVTTCDFFQVCLPQKNDQALQNDRRNRNKAKIRRGKETTTDNDETQMKTEHHVSRCNFAQIMCKSVMFMELPILPKEKTYIGFNVFGKCQCKCHVDAHIRGPCCFLSQVVLAAVESSSPTNQSMELGVRCQLLFS